MKIEFVEQAIRPPASVKMQQLHKTAWRLIITSNIKMSFPSLTLTVFSVGSVSEVSR